MQGFVKFFKGDRGWGVIVSPDVPGDVWVHFSQIEGDGFREFHAGDVVELDVEEVAQPPFRFRAVRARFVRSGPAPTLRRIDGKLVIAAPGAAEHAPVHGDRQVLDGS